MQGQVALHRLRVRVPRAPREPLPLARLLGHGMRLPLGDHLDPVLEAAKHDVRLGQLVAVAAGEEAGIEQARHSMEPATDSEAARLELQPGSDVLVVERVRTADGKPVVLSRDILPGRLIAKQPELADEMLKRSIYEVLERDLGVVIHHGVASFRPVRADVTVARRLGVPRGELLLAIWQVDYSDDGVPVLSSYEYHLADAFEFTVLRRGPGRRLS